MLYCIFLFKVIPIIFQAIKNHHGEQCASEVPLQEIMHCLSALIYRKICFVLFRTFICRYIVHPYSEFIVVLKFKIVLNFFSVTLQKPNGEIHGCLLRHPGQSKRLGQSTKVD